MVISNALICDINAERMADVRIEEGVVVEIGSSLKDVEMYDAKGAYLLPLLVDTNIRLQDGILNANNIQKVAQEAACGGVGHLVLSPDSTPAIDNEVVLEYAQNSLHRLENCKIDMMINSLKEDATLSNIAILLKKGALVPYMSTFAKNNLAIKIAQYAQMYRVTLFCKAEDHSLVNSGVMLEGDMSSRLGLAGIPEMSELLHVSRMIEIARYYKIKILFKAIASPVSIKLIQKAKEEGVDVHSEVSLHHLLHSDMACENFNTTAKLNPPLASYEDMQALQDALKRGEIDVLTTLHQPNSPVNKEVAFYDAAYGCEALGDALGLYYTKLVKSGLITMQELLKRTAANPARLLGYEAGFIEVGTKAAFSLFDPHAKKVIKNSQSLYNNETIYGSVERVFYFK